MIEGTLQVFLCSYNQKCSSHVPESSLHLSKIITYVVFFSFPGYGVIGGGTSGDIRGETTSGDLIQEFGVTYCKRNDVLVLFQVQPSL